MQRLTIAVAVLLALAGPAAAQQPIGPAAGAAAPRFHDARLATGMRMRYAVQGDPAGPAVILLHGYSDSWFSWSRVLPLLPAQWRVYAPDLRGHGDSDRPVDGYTPAAFAQDVIAFMDAVGIDRATIVGHSNGGLVTQALIASAPDRVERAMIVSAVTTARNIPGIEEFRATVMALGDPVDLAFVRGFQESTVAVPVPPGFMDRVVQESLKLPARVWQAIMTGIVEAGAVEGLRSTRVPVVIVWGDRDAIMPRSEQDALLELIPGSSLIVYEGIGHAPTWEVPDRFAADLIAFVGGDRS